VKITHLSLTDFRNYESAEIALGDGSNLLIGKNGQGKTNLIEALGYLSTLGSHRVASDQAMIRAGHESAIVRAKLEHDGRVNLAEVQLNRSGANRAQINRSAIKIRELPRYFSSVLFAPEDLALVRGEPSGRRRFLDELLILRAPRMSGVLADYERVLKQRNTLLKSARSSAARGAGLQTLDIWDERLVTLGTQVIEARQSLIAELVPEVLSAYAAIAGHDHEALLTSHLSVLATTRDRAEVDAAAIPVQHDALTREEVTSAFTNALTSVRRAEIERGITLVGPHRDDLVLVLNGLPARSHASQGESWSFALSLKLAAAQVLRRESHSGDPVLMLDDVFAELDESRRGPLAAAGAELEQVIITAAVLDDVPPALSRFLIRVSAGHIVQGGGDG